MDTNLGKLWEIVRSSAAWHAAIMGLQRVGQDLATEQYVRQTVNKDLLYDTGNSTPYSVITYWDKNLKKNEYVYNWITFLYTWNKHIINKY